MGLTAIAGASFTKNLKIMCYNKVNDSMEEQVRLSSRRRTIFIEKWFKEDGQELADYILELCDLYWEVKLLKTIDHEDGSVTCRWAVAD